MEGNPDSMAAIPNGLAEIKNLVTLSCVQGKQSTWLCLYTTLKALSIKCPCGQRSFDRFNSAASVQIFPHAHPWKKGDPVCRIHKSSSLPEGQNCLIATAGLSPPSFVLIFQCLSQTPCFFPDKHHIILQKKYPNQQSQEDFFCLEKSNSDIEETSYVPCEQDYGKPGPNATGLTME